VKTSIIILVQDRYNFFKRCVDSILQYTKSPYEFVFVVQGAKDPRILDLITSIKDVDVTYTYNQFNTGVTPGRNQGIDLSLGDFLLFFDDDAYVSEDLNILTEEEKKLDWLGRLTSYVKDNVGVVGQSGTYINTDTPGIFWECKTKGYKCDVVQGYCFLFTREVVNKIGQLDPFFGKFWHEESEYALHAKSAGFEVINCGYIGVTHASSNSGDDGTYGTKIDYMFSKWKSQFNKILVPRNEWK
jgi:O-antigen biosynthesis protein